MAKQIKLVKVLSEVKDQIATAHSLGLKNWRGCNTT